MKIVFIFSGLLQYKGRLLKQIRTLQEAGHECILIHGQVEESPPHYADYPFQTVPIRLVRHPNKVRNTLHHLQFNLAALDALPGLAPDVIVCVELYGALSGAVARARGIAQRFVFDSNELFMHMGMRRLKKRVWAPIHAYVFRKADVILHAEQHRMEYCRRHYRSSAHHFVLENLPDWFPLDDARLRPSLPPVRLLYLGALHPSRQCVEMARIIGSLRDSVPIEMDFIGFGSPAYESELTSAAAHSAGRVRILPPVSHERIGEVMGGYHIGFVYYDARNLNNLYCAPNKLYQYVMHGLPVISSDNPSVRDVVEGHRVGVCLERLTADDVRRAVERISAEDMAANITENLRRRFCWERQATDYVRLIETGETPEPVSTPAV